MRKRFTLLAAAAVLGACGSSAAQSSSAATAVCGPADARTLAADGVVRVYVISSSVFGCSMHGTKAYRLGQRKTCIGATRVDPVVVAGELAASGSERCGVDTGNTLVVVRRLTDGKRLRAAAATTPPGVESYQSVRSLVLKSTGAVAWIGTGRSIVGHGPPKIEVYKADRGHAIRLLDSGSLVRPGSLTLAGSTLTWKHGTTLMHATLS